MNGENFLKGILEKLNYEFVRAMYLGNPIIYHIFSKIIIKTKNFTSFYIGPLV